MIRNLLGRITLSRLQCSKVLLFISSILSGILKGEGTIQANQTYDLVPTYDYIYFDGIYFRNKMNDEELYKVERFEIGALYEIGRILAENGIR